jgi:hypothetical protein
MGGPLDLGEVDTFLDHLVERRELAEVLDDVDDLVGDVIDFRLVVEAAETKADGAVCDVVAEAEPELTAMSLMPMSSDSPSTYTKLMFRLPGRWCSMLPLTWV